MEIQGIRKGGKVVLHPRRQSAWSTYVVVDWSERISNLHSATATPSVSVTNAPRGNCENAPDGIEIVRKTSRCYAV